MPPPDALIAAARPWRLPARLVAGGAAILATSALADSTIEHYRGSFHNPVMIAPLGAALISTSVNAAQAGGAGGARSAHIAAVVTGAAGLGFHFYNIASRPGKWRLNNLFYGAPIGAPAALILSGNLGDAARALASGAASWGPVPLNSGGAVGALTAIGLAGSAAEAGLLHFRGAYHNPAMWLPITLPPLAAASLAIDVMTQRSHGRSVVLLGMTALLGFAGAGFHIYGVARNMGGWRNWRQNLLAGPPIPAPPSFTGLALAGLGAWLLIRRRAHG